MSRTMLVLHKWYDTSTTSLNLDLTQNGTFGRASSALYYTQAPNSAGSFLATAGTGVRRSADTRGDGIAPSLLMEKASTNYIPTNQAITSADWTNTADVTTNQHAGPDGGNLADRVNHAANAFGPRPNNASIGPAGQVIGSTWMRAVSGTGTQQFYVFHNNGGSSLRANVLASSTTYKRNEAQGNATNNSCLFVADGRDLAGLGVPGGTTAHAEDHYFDLTQLEPGYYPTSPIKNTGSSTATRPADTLSYANGSYPTSFLTTGALIQFAPDASSSEIGTAGEDWRLLQIGTNDSIRIRSGIFNTCVAELVCGGSVVASRTITFSRFQLLTIIGEPSVGTLTVSGATSGNGSTTGTGAAWASGQTLYVGGDNAGINNVTGRYVSGSIFAVNPLSVSISGEVLVSGTLTNSEVGSVSSRQWQRASDFAGGGSYSDIGGATSTTYSPVGADMGYDLRCKVTDAYGRAAYSNVLRYEPATATAMIDVFKIREKSAGALASITGSKTGKSMLQPTGGNQPSINATSFNSTPGLDFVGTSSTFMSGNLNLSGMRDVTIVMGIKEILTISNGVFGAPFVHGAVGSVNGSFELVSNTFQATTPPYFFQVIGNGGSTALGGKYIDESALAATPTVVSFGLSTNNSVLVNFVRYNNVDQSLTNYDNQCVAGDFANTLLYWGQTAGGGLKWTGTMGGAFMILTGSTSTSQLWSAENYIKNGTNLTY